MFSRIKAWFKSVYSAALNKEHQIESSFETHVKNELSDIKAAFEVLRKAL